MSEEGKKIAVVLSGCGVFDGTEIHEAVLTLLAIEEEGASWHCFAPNVEQMHVINHATGEVEEGLKEMFLSRVPNCPWGEKLADLAEYDPSEYDAIVFPGGFGGAKNLSDFAVRNLMQKLMIQYPMQYLVHMRWANQLVLFV